MHPENRFVPSYAISGWFDGKIVSEIDQNFVSECCLYKFCMGLTYTSLNHTGYLAQLGHIWIATVHKMSEMTTSMISTRCVYKSCMHAFKHYQLCVVYLMAYCNLSGRGMIVSLFGNFIFAVTFVDELIIMIQILKGVFILFSFHLYQNTACIILHM